MSFTNVGNVCFTRGSNSMGSIGGSAGPAASNVRFQNNAQQSAMMQMQRVAQKSSFSPKPDPTFPPQPKISQQAGTELSCTDTPLREIFEKHKDKSLFYTLFK